MMKEAGTRVAPTTSKLSIGAGCAGGVTGACCAVSGVAAHASSGHTSRRKSRRIRDRQTAAPPEGRRRGCVKPGCPSP